MNKTWKYLSLAASLSLAIIGCGGSGSGSATYSCNNIPEDSALTEIQGCDEPLEAGKTTLYSFIESSGNTVSVKQCNLSLSGQLSIPTSQADYNDRYIQEPALGITQTSNNDYIQSGSCTSASLTISTDQGPTSAVDTHIWIVQP